MSTETPEDIDPATDEYSDDLPRKVPHDDDCQCHRCYMLWLKWRNT